ncbi:ATP-binding protein [Paraclostridium ghonii]|uniref:ATP-binding protein n=1 Tax=Paraclostridium ghonii TaxID=29358 RepID=UPI00202CDB2F|nr:ATP-binding protein [Paeniclostridium ghonii]MCM0167133.1 ATP-binding protein [Paeniclostridium ghonii]
MKVYALVGESGSGKSYKALELAYENNINYIIDDGILIHKNKIIAGISAKQASTKIQAVKRAIFNNDSHREEVKSKIMKENIETILIIGTSDKMVNQISNKLNLGKIYKTIYIDDISTQDEINIAKEWRKKGNHIIPLPTLEVKSIASGLSINPIKRLFKRDNKEAILVEKTIIRPTFSYMGNFYIKKNAINQIIFFELSKFDYISKINSVKFNNKNGNLEIFITLELNLLNCIENIVELQKHIIKSLYDVTLINVSRVDISINRVNSFK